MGVEYYGKLVIATRITKKGKFLVCWGKSSVIHIGIQKGQKGQLELVGHHFHKKSRLCREGHQQRLVEMHPMAEAAGTKTRCLGVKKGR